MLARSSRVRLALRSCRFRRVHSDSPPADNVQITTLPNKIRVATDTTPSHFATLGVYVDAGPRYESLKQIGASHFIERLAFKTSKSITAQSMASTVEGLGGQAMCASSREAIIYQISHFKADAVLAMNVLAETILKPAFLGEEIQNVKDASRYELREMQQRPEMLLPEVLHRVAYGKDGLGNPIICSEDTLDQVDAAVLRSFMYEWYRPERLVIAAAGIDHQNLVTLSSDYFSSMTSSSSLPSSRVDNYTGGYHHRLDITEGLTHLYIGFKGLPISHPGIYALAVVQFLLGGGGSFSAGGPGKGMYSRFYTDILNQHPEIDHCAAFHHIYADTSLFGIHASFYNSKNDMGTTNTLVLRRLLNQLRQLLITPTGRQELDRAKNQLKSSLVMALESQATAVEDLGRQILVRGYRIPVLEMCREIDNVTSRDVVQVAHLIFGQACRDPVSVVVQGPVGIETYKSTFKEQGVGG